MKIEGVWKVELLGPYGWENISIAFLEAGRYLAGSTDHFTVGTYEEAGDTLKISIRVTQLGRLQTVFGETERTLNTVIEARFDDEKTILGKAYPAERRDTDVQVRLIRIGDIN